MQEGVDLLLNKVLFENLLFFFQASKALFKDVRELTRSQGSQNVTVPFRHTQVILKDTLPGRSPFCNICLNYHKSTADL